MDSGDLESALSKAKEGVGNKEEGSKKEMSREEEIGFHKGAVNTLMAERNELLKMVRNVEGIASAHVKRLQELGVDVK